MKTYVWTDAVSIEQGRAVNKRRARHAVPTSDDVMMTTTTVNAIATTTIERQIFWRNCGRERS